MNEAEPGPIPPPSPPTDERLLELLAEVELIRRKASLLDARLAQWEARLDDACAVVDGLVGAIDPQRDPEARLTALEARVERLDRRRRSPSPPPAAPPPLEADRRRPAAPPPPSPAVAIVRARWQVEGETPAGPVRAPLDVELLADVDGVPPGESVEVEVHPLGSATVAAILEARSDGDRIHARWRVPGDTPDRAWCFTARRGPAVSTSPPLHVA